MIRSMRDALWKIIELLFLPLNYGLSLLLKDAVYPNSVLHISRPGHIPYYTVQLLRKQGYKADYLAIGSGSKWDTYDYHLPDAGFSILRKFKEHIFFWQVMSRYEVLHLHFILSLSATGWEFPILKRMGRKIVVHHRGCSSRNRAQNMALHPEMNICQVCDYHAVACSAPSVVRRQKLGRSYGDVHLVTTPDLLDFVPDGIHMPFFALTPDTMPHIALPAVSDWVTGQTMRVVHVTNHPGIEGTQHIQAAIANLQKKDFDIDFLFLKGVPHEEVLEVMGTAHISIGKMKMGYYANAQIEAMQLGVPTITYIRPEFMTPELHESGFIFASLDTLEGTLEYYLTHPDKLAEKRALARKSILALHDNVALTHQLIQLYQDVNQR